MPFLPAFPAQKHRPEAALGFTAVSADQFRAVDTYLAFIGFEEFITDRAYHNGNPQMKGEKQKRREEYLLNIDEDSECSQQHYPFMNTDIKQDLPAPGVRPHSGG